MSLKKSSLVVLGIMMLAALACNIPALVPALGGATPTPTRTRIPTNTPRPTSTPTPLPAADLQIQQILLRYDPLKSLGNVEVTVCNWGDVASAYFEVSVSVGGVQHRIAHTDAI